MRKQSGDNTCYVRFRGTEKEEFYCDEKLEEEKRQDLARFQLGDGRSENETQRLSASPYPPLTREQIQQERSQYLNEIDRQYNSLHIKSSKGYPDRFLQFSDLQGGSAGIYLTTISPLLNSKQK